MGPPYLSERVQHNLPMNDFYCVLQLQVGYKRCTRCMSSLFTQPRRREILRTSPFTISANFAVTEFSEVRMALVLCCQYPRTHYGPFWSGLSGERLRVPQDLLRSATKC